jgi:hypothetical protein
VQSLTRFVMEGHGLLAIESNGAPETENLRTLYSKFSMNGSATSHS